MIKASGAQFTAQTPAVKYCSVLCAAAGTTGVSGLKLCPHTESLIAPL